jgi:hypothetical protein
MMQIGPVQVDSLQVGLPQVKRKVGIFLVSLMYRVFTCAHHL